MMRARGGVCGLLLVAALTGGAAEAAFGAGTARLPRPRPAIVPPPGVSNWAAAAESRFRTADATPGGGVARLPRPRPVTPPVQLASLPPATAAPPEAPPPAGDATGDAACLDALRALGVAFTPMPPLDLGGECEVSHPLNVTALGSGVSIAPETILDCETTRSLAEWVKDVVVPEAERTLGAQPDGIEQDSAYVCRHRYDDPHQKISEHAHANAIDVASFAFSGRAAVGIGRNAPGSKEAEFETAVRAGSCRYFTTVLGPGSNAAHATHFHLDMAVRKGGYRLCELSAPMTARALPNTTRE